MDIGDNAPTCGPLRPGGRRRAVHALQLLGPTVKILESSGSRRRSEIYELHLFETKLFSSSSEHHETC